MTPVDHLVADVNIPTYGEWTTEDFCGDCRILDLGASRITHDFCYQLGYTRKDRDSTCSFCRFVKERAHQSGVNAVYICNEILTRPIPHRVLFLALRNRGVRVKDLYLLRLSLITNEDHQTLPGVRTEVSIMEAMKRRFGSKQSSEGTENGACFKRPLRYRCPDKTSVDFEFIKRCIAGCQQNHVRQCTVPDPASIARLKSSDFRLIDCEQRVVVQPQGIPDFVALSYVWGGSMQQNVDKTETHKGDENTLPQFLPQTIEDAMEFALQLGFRYIWIDKYCIIQSGEHVNLQGQLTVMDSVYHCAAATIIAAYGEDADSGLPGVGNTPRSAYPTFKINGETWVCGTRDTQEVVNNSSWATRGWTYQEDHFARRRLIFTEEQVLFECNMCRRNEALQFEISADRDLSSDTFGAGTGARRAVLPLNRHIKLYTKRSLSYQSDALNALQGIFTSFLSRKEPVKQLWGIPLDTSADPGQTLPGDIPSLFADRLMWDVTSRNIAKRRTGFPSWSWAGWIAPVEWPVHSDSTYKRLRISVLKRDGTFTPLTEDLVDSIVQDISRKTSLYTYNLLVESEVWRVEFRDLREYKGDVDWDKNGFDFKYAVVDNTRGGNDRHYWLLHHTVAIEDGDELHKMLCRDTFQCIRVTFEWGIVVRELNGVHERIGLLDLGGKTKERIENPWKYDIHSQWQEKNLRPSSYKAVKKIILG